MQTFEINVRDDRAFSFLGDKYLMAAIVGSDRLADGSTVTGVTPMTGEQFWTSARGDVMAVDVLAVTDNRGEAQAWKVNGVLPNH